MIRFEKVGEILAQVRAVTDFVIIGDTILDLALNRKGTESDVDVFPTSISAFAEEDRIRELAYSKGWDFGRTPIDTPRVIATIDAQQLQIDFYDNIQDFFIPQKVLEDSVEVKLGKYSFRAVSLEDYVLLKANAFRDEDEDELKTIFYMIGEGRISLDRDKIAERSNLFEENAGSIVQRLRSVGILRSS